MRIERQRRCKNPGEEDLWSGNTGDQQAAVKGQYPSKVKVRTTDQARVSVVRGWKCSFSVWVRSDSTGNVDFEH